MNGVSFFIKIYRQDAQPGLKSHKNIWEKALRREKFLRLSLFGFEDYFLVNNFFRGYSFRHNYFINITPL